MAVVAAVLRSAVLPALLLSCAASREGTESVSLPLSLPSPLRSVSSTIPWCPVPMETPCIEDLARAPHLLLFGDPRPGGAIEFVANACRPTRRAWLVMGRERADLDLARVGPSGCTLVPAPEAVVEVGSGDLWQIRVPVPRDGGGQGFFVQLVAADKDLGLLPSVLYRVEIESR